MTSKWDSEFTQEKLQDQIKAAKEKYKELRFRAEDVWYQPRDKRIYLDFTDDNGTVDQYCFSRDCFKCLEGKTEEEILKVSLLGERAIQWDELDIQIDIYDLLMSIQLRENWVKGLGK